MHVGISADHAGFEMKERIVRALSEAGYDAEDLGPFAYDPNDDYPDFVIPLAEAVADAQVDRAISICGSGIGAAIAANKVSGARAAPVLDPHMARSSVEDNDLNVLCLGSRFLDFDLGWAIVQAFLGAEFAQKPRHQRLVEKVAAIERGEIEQ
jgi:ribose 5-phosphate isomerase B